MRLPQNILAICRRIDWYLTALILIAVFTHLEWFNPFSLLFSWDWKLWPNEIVKSLIYGGQGTYLSYFGFGSQNIQIYFNFLLTIWGMIGSSILASKITVMIPVALLSVASPYLLIKYILNNRRAAFLGALVFAFSTSVIGKEFSHLYLALSFALIPLVLLGFIRLLDEPSPQRACLFVVLFNISASIEMRMTYLIVLILLLYFIYFCYARKSIVVYLKNIYRYIVWLLGLSASMQLFWVLPTLSAGTTKITDVATRGIFGNQFANILYAFANYLYSWTGGRPASFVAEPINFTAWFAPLVAFFVVLIVRANRRKKLQVYLLFFSTLTLVGILLSKQAGAPFPNLYQWLYDKFPGFVLFRESSKFFILVALGYGTLFAFTWVRIEQLNLYRWINVTAFFIFSALLLYSVRPLITQEIGHTFVPRQEHPDYRIYNSVLDKDKDYYRTLWIPTGSAWGWFLYNHPKASLVNILQNDLVSLVHLDDQKMIEERLVEPLGLKYFDSLFDLGSIKYIVVPIQDDVNDVDLFVDYGGKSNSTIRQWYIDQLDKVSFLSRVDIGTTNLVVYENKDYKPPVFAADHLYSFDSAVQLDEKFNAANGLFGDDFLFAVKDKGKTEAPLTYLGNPFEVLGPNNLTPDGIVVSRELTGPQGQLTFNTGSAGLFASVQNNKLVIYEQRLGRIVANGENTDDHVGQPPQTIDQVRLAGSLGPYIAFGDSLVRIKGGFPVDLGSASQSKKLAVMVVQHNVVVDPSFESGPWQDKVGDCHNYDKNPIIAMSLDADEKTDGAQSLQLEATRHFACVVTKIALNQAGDYALAFDYQSPNAQKAGYYLSFNDPAKTVVRGTLAVADQSWNSFTRPVQVPTGVTTARLYFYAYESDGVTNNIVRYDNVRFGPLVTVADIPIPEASGFEKVPLTLKEGENTFEYRDDRYSFVSILPNPSFEDGLWQDKVGDCKSYDKNPVIAMSASAEEKSDGRQSLQLEATRHIACVKNTLPVKGGATYLLAFDYQSPNAKEASYYVGFNDDQKTVINERLPLADTQWHSFLKIINVPEGATSLSLYVYARETDGKTNIINRYDNFKLIEVPDLRGAYYLVSEPERKLAEPRSVDFELINPTKKLVHISGATTPFFLAMSESYHDQWQLQLANSKISGWLNSWGPWAKPDRVADEYHYKLDGFLNAWYVDVDAWCAAGNNPACRRNADGSWDLDLVIEFWPQRWFYLGLLISGLTLAGCLGYLGSKGTQALRRRYGQKKARG